jgi:hypothetical protein
MGKTKSSNGKEGLCGGSWRIAADDGGAKIPVVQKMKTRAPPYTLEKSVEV